jgi:hypothetical protein
MSLLFFQPYLSFCLWWPPYISPNHVWKETTYRRCRG